MRTRFLLSILATLALPLMAIAQCPSPATGLSAQSGACTVRLSWTPQTSSAVLQTVLRAPIDNLNAAVEIQTLPPSISTFDDTTASRGTFFYYWIRTALINPNCPVVTSSSLRAALSNSSSQSIVAVPVCNGISVTVSPVFDATSYIFIRVDENYQNSAEVGTSTTTTFTDTTAIPGKTYHYGCLPRGICGGPAATGGSNPVYSGVFNLSPPSAPVVVDAGQTVYFQTNITAVNPVIITWTRDGVPLSSADPRYVTLGTENVGINNARTSDTGLYRAIVTNSCGTFVSDPILVAVRPGCRADFDESGSLAPADIFAFLNSWFAGCP